MEEFKKELLINNFRNYCVFIGFYLTLISITLLILLKYLCDCSTQFSSGYCIVYILLFVYLIVNAVCLTFLKIFYNINRKLIEKYFLNTTTN